MTLEPRARNFRFGSFAVDTGRRLLLRGGAIVPLSSKTFDLLVALIEGREALITKQELLARVWPNQFIEEGNLTVHVSTLRKALGELRGEHRYIATIPGRGYRFVAEVREGGAAVEEPVNHDAHDAAPTVPDVPPAPRTRRRQMVAAGIIVGALLLAAVAQMRTRAEARGVAARPEMTSRLLTARGDVSSAVLAPDGTYFAYVSFTDGKESLWLGRASGEPPLELRGASDALFEGLAFSPGGDRVYYSVDGALFEIAVLGGTPRKMLDGVRGGFALSPDGKRVAFVRRSADRRSSAIVIAELDGSARERRLAELLSPREFSSNGPAWSPDGSRLAIGAMSDSAVGRYALMSVRVADGAVAPFGTRLWDAVDRVAWLHDGTGIVFHATGASSDYHIWLLDLASKELRCLTPDLSRYGRASVSVSDDGTSLLVLRGEISSSVWVSPSTDISHARAITSRAYGKLDGSAGLTWTHDGRIVYASFFNNSHSLWSMTAEGLDPRPLTPSGNADRFPRATADGRYVVFESDRGGGSDIWRMDADGSHLHRLTHGGHHAEPTLTPDSRWVLFAERGDGGSSIWKISIDGGVAERVTSVAARWPVVSPDGTLLAYASSDSGGMGAQARLTIRSLADGRTVKELALAPGATINNGFRWLPDGSALTYRNFSGGLWRQPLTGASPSRMTGVPDVRIYYYDWSPNGRQFAMSYGDEVRDVVLMRGFR